jgi:hypothetical protein
MRILASSLVMTFGATFGLAVAACGPPALKAADVSSLKLGPRAERAGGTCLVHPVPLRLIAAMKDGTQRDTTAKKESERVDLTKGLTFSATVGKVSMRRGPGGLYTEGEAAAFYDPPADARQLLDKDIVIAVAMAEKPEVNTKFTVVPTFDGCEAVFDYSGAAGGNGARSPEARACADAGFAGRNGLDGYAGSDVEVRLSQLASKKYGDLVLAEVRTKQETSSFLMSTRGAKLTIYSNGGAGGMGSAGWDGNDSCTQGCSTNPNGGDGGDGGSGGNGGAGGKIRVLYDRAYPDLAGIILTENRGAAGGNGAGAGQGGRSVCARAHGRNGKPGSAGQQGADGPRPEVVASDRVFEGDLPKSTARVEAAAQGGARPGGSSSTTTPAATASDKAATPTASSSAVGSWDALKIPGGFSVTATNKGSANICKLELAKSPGNLLKTPLKKGETRELVRTGTIPKYKKDERPNKFRIDFLVTPCDSTTSTKLPADLAATDNQLLLK